MSLLMLLGLSCFNVEFQARFFTLLFHPHLILKCNMSPNEVCVVCPSHSHPFINLGVILGSTLLAIHSNPIICPLHPHCRYLSIPSVPRSLQKPKAPAPSPSSLVIQNLHHTNRASMNAWTCRPPPAFTPPAAPCHQQDDRIPYLVCKVPLICFLPYYADSWTNESPHKFLFTLQNCL